MTTICTILETAKSWSSFLSGRGSKKILLIPMQLSIPPMDPILDALLLCALPTNAVILWREAVSANGNAGVELQNLQRDEKRAWQ